MKIIEEQSFLEESPRVEAKLQKISTNNSSTMTAKNTEIDIISGKDFSASKIAGKLEKKGFKTNVDYVKFKEDREELEEDIKEKIESDIVLGHCYVGTILLEIDQVKIIAIDPPNLKMRKEKIEIGPEEKQKIILSEEVEERYDFEAETVPGSEHSFKNSSNKLAKTIEARLT